jgi:hypothetical protein
MPTFPPGTEVAIRPEFLRRLSFPPPEGSVVLVAIHEAGLQAQQSRHTQLLGFSGGELSWAGAFSELLLEVKSEGGGDPRQLLGEAVGTGPRLWDVVWPGELVSDPGGGPLATTYQGERPWVVIGITTVGDLLAAPLNEAGNPKWYTPLLAQGEVLMPGSSKDAQLELAHIWSLPQFLGAVGSVAPAARERVLEALKSYF